MRRNAHDVVIVGGGLCGSWAAKALAEAGVNVLVLEAGAHVRADVLAPETRTREARKAASARQRIQSQHPAYWTHDPTLFVDDLDHPYQSSGEQPFVWIRGRQVGGRGLTWGGVTPRFSDYEFRAASRDGFGGDWPVSHADLSGFYSEVESFFGVSGKVEGLAQLPDGVFTSPPDLTDAERLFSEAVTRVWPARTVTHSRAVSEIAAAPGSGDAAWPRRTPQHQMLPDALRTGRVQIRAGSVVSKLLTDSTGRRITGVECVDSTNRSTFVVPSRAVALCASTIESVRIMRNSSSAAHPCGVGNSFDLLGRYLLDHAVCMLVGYVPGDRGDHTHPFGGPNGILVPRFHNIDDARAPFLRGYGIWGNLGRGVSSNGQPLWTLCAMLEVLPRAENAIETDPNRPDIHGIPTPLIRFSHSANEREMRQDAWRRLQEMVDAVGWPVVHRANMPPGTFVHELGGARMGTRPESSVVDPFNRCWDARNLFVLDGACFVTSGWQNPTLTMLALGGRACRRIAEDVKTGDL